MKQFVLGLGFACSLLINGVDVSAAPFEPKDVAADPAVLFYLDCDALRDSSIGKAILADADAQKKLTTVAALFDFDLRTQLHGLTVYATEEHPKDGVLIVYADFDPNRLTLLAKAADSSESTTNGAHVIYSWLNGKKEDDNGDRKRVYGSILGHRVLFGQDESHLADALDVIEGKNPNFSGKEGLPQATTGESVIAQGVVLKFPIDSGDQNAAIFKMSKSVRLKLSQAGNNIDASLHFEASDDNTATQLAAIAQGLVAILKLQKTDTNVLELANAIAIKQNGSAVAVAMSLPITEVVDKVKEVKDASMKSKDTTKKAQDPDASLEQK